MTGPERSPVRGQTRVHPHDAGSPTRHFEEMSPIGHYAENELVEESPQLVRRRFPTFSRRETNTAMALALTAWTVAVFDYGLFGTLLPAMQQDFGWTAEWAYLVNTLIAVGTAIVAFGVGPVAPRLSDDPVHLEAVARLGEAMDFLYWALDDGPLPAEEVFRRAAQQGIKRGTLRRAKIDLGVSSRKLGPAEPGGPGWLWIAPGRETPQPGRPHDPSGPSHPRSGWDYDALDPAHFFEADLNN